MVKNEDYKKILNSFISCVSHGDYYSIKEMSKLQLEKIERQEDKIDKEIKKIKNIKKLRNCKTKPLEELNNKELISILEKYSTYIINQVKKANNIEILQQEILTVDEFIKKI